MPPDHPNRNSDLCAQWQAADAALRSAEADEAQVSLTKAGIVIGLLTLIAAGAAAWYAKKAADHTETGALEAQAANKIAKRAQRPWVTIEAEPLWGNIAQSGRASFACKVNLKNIGALPALNVFCVHLGLHFDNEAEWNFDEFFENDVVADENSSEMTILPGQPISAQRQISFDPDERNRLPSFAIKITYLTPDDEICTTGRVYHASWDRGERVMLGDRPFKMENLRLYDSHIAFAK